MQTELYYNLVLVSNPNGLGTDMLPEKDFLPVQNFMLDTFRNEDIVFSYIILDGSLAAENSPLRKPRTGRMTKYLLDPEADIRHSFVIGDRITDMQFAANLGCKGIFINPTNERGMAEITDTPDFLRTHVVVLGTMDWKDVYDFLTRQDK